MGVCLLSECKSWSWSKELTCYINGDIPQSQFDLQYWGGIASIKGANIPRISARWFHRKIYIDSLILQLVSLIVCSPQPCNVFDQIKIIGIDLHETHPLVPAGDSMVVSSAEECCKRCQEYPGKQKWILDPQVTFIHL